MPQSEFEAWLEFYRRYPFDDYHRFHRPAAMLATTMKNDDRMQQRLDWLQPDRSRDGLSDADVTTMRTFGYMRKGG